MTGFLIAGQCHHKRLRHARGVALPLVLLISSMMLATSAVWFETTLMSARGNTNTHDYLQAFHAADSALTLCARTITADFEPPLSLLVEEPTSWKNEATFEANAFTAAAQWPGSGRAPQCLIEPWRLISRPEAQAFLITARGFGATTDTQVWLQLEVVLAGERMERHWRRVAARPF
ncbi:MAG TPA: pilus assembly protein [Paraburkholderia sp.]|nr:pilus assembly protein [Paraburkholderia sp.]